jgi:hypothetical protein
MNATISDMNITYSLLKQMLDGNHLYTKAYLVIIINHNPTIKILYIFLYYIYVVQLDSVHLHFFLTFLENKLSTFELFFGF